MSGAQYGYVDPSIDKAAADETDEVELEVVCLTGEGLKLSVNRSMLGSDLRRLVSEASMEARRKARRASCEWKSDAGSKLARARDCWKICNGVLHLHTN